MDHRKLLGMLVTSSLLAGLPAEASERARAAALRVARHIKQAATVETKQGATRGLRTVEGLLASDQDLRLRRTRVGSCLWDNRVRNAAGRELYWQSSDGRVRDLRIVQTTRDGTRFLAGRNLDGTIDVAGRLAADGTQAVLAQRSTEGTEHLTLTQLGPTRVAYRYLWQLRGSSTRTASGTVRFAAPVSLAQLTVEAARQGSDLRVTFAETPLLQREVVDEKTGKALRLPKFAPWEGFFVHGSDVVLDRGAQDPPALRPETRVLIQDLWRQIGE